MRRTGKFVADALGLNLGLTGLQLGPHGGTAAALVDGVDDGVDQRTEVNYIAEKTSWLANGLFKAGAVGIDPEGIVEVTTNEAGAA